MAFFHRFKNLKAVIKVILIIIDKIAISSILAKIFDIIALDAQYDSLSTDVLQFGFNKNASTVICTSILLDTIEYFNENNTDCYILLLLVDIRHWHMQIYYMNVINISTINNYLQSG